MSNDKMKREPIDIPNMVSNTILLILTTATIIWFAYAVYHLFIVEYR